MIHYGGKISAHSDGLGLGSTFEVAFKLISAPPQAQRGGTAHGEGELQTGSVRVLVVDDSVGAAKMLQRILDAYWNHDIQLAHDGHSACEVARSFRPDVIFRDIGLPGKNGYEVARDLRAESELFSRTKIIALTGYGAKDDRTQSRQSGIDLHLVKPVSVDVLRQVFTQLDTME